MVKIVQRRKIWFILSLILISASIFALVKWNLKLGIDFTGGTLMEFSFKDDVLSNQEIKDSLKELELGEVNVQFSGDKTVLLRFKDINEDTHQKIIEALGSTVAEKSNNSGNSSNDIKEDKGEQIKASIEDMEVNSENIQLDNDEAVIEETDSEEEAVEIDSASENVKDNIEEKRFDSIGPVIGNELKSTAVVAIVVALIAIVLYIGWAFRKVSRPVSSFKYGIIATIALFHDVIITLGVFSVLGYLYNVEVGIPFIAALLAILGYSVNDTIVVFDRTRENLLRFGSDEFENVVNKSVNETLIRSLNTSFTTLLILFTLYLFGGTTIKYFIVALIIGISAGTYSSIFIASPLLVSWQKWTLKRRLKQ
ncbi:MAG: protein translocase subunit SecF [Patescibacteria group bacterium]|nr:protein translocase subunit SecF [Patescibacteria group bacterium]